MKNKCKLSARTDSVMETVVLLLLAAWCFAALILKIITVDVSGDVTSLSDFAQSDFRLFLLLFALAALVCLTVCNVAEKRGKTARETVLLRLLCAAFGG